MDVAVRDHRSRNSLRGEVEPYPTQVMICNSKTSSVPVVPGPLDERAMTFVQPHWSLPRFGNVCPPGPKPGRRRRARNRFRRHFPHSREQLWAGSIAKTSGRNRAWGSAVLVPTKRRVYAYEGDYRLVKEPLLVAVDMGEIKLL